MTTLGKSVIVSYYIKKDKNNGLKKKKTMQHGKLYKGTS